MQISLTFNPAEDKHDHVSSVVNAVYGVKSSPNAQAVQTAQPTPASPAPMSPVASQPDANATVNQSANAAPVVVADFPNSTTAPTAAAPGAATPSVAGVDLDKNGIPWDARIHSGGRDENGNPKKNADGKWAKRKGVSDLEVSNVTKELQNLMAASIGNGVPPSGLPVGGVLGNPVNVPHQQAVPVAGQPDAYVVAPATAPQGQAQAAPVAMAPAGAPAPGSAASNVAPQVAPVSLAGVAPMPIMAPNVAPMPAPMPVATVPTDFASLAQWMAPQMEEAGGKLSQAHVEHFCRQCGIVNGQGQGEFSLVANRPDAIQWLYEAFQAQIAAMQGQ